MLLFIAIYIGRANGAPVLPLTHHMFLPLGASPLVMSPSLLTALHSNVPGWDQLAGNSSSHSTTPTTTTDASPPVITPSYFGSSVEVPSYLPILMMTGILISMATGAAALIHHLRRQHSSSPNLPSYETLEEELIPQEGEIGSILAKEAHLRTPEERLTIDRWERLTFNKWTSRRMLNPNQM